HHPRLSVAALFFFFTPPAPPHSYPLSLPDALPISFFDRELAYRRAMQYPPLFALVNVVVRGRTFGDAMETAQELVRRMGPAVSGDRKSTRLNSSHVATSYAVFCLKKKKKTTSIMYT